MWTSRTNPNLTQTQLLPTVELKAEKKMLHSKTIKLECHGRKGYDDLLELIFCKPLALSLRSFHRKTPHEWHGTR